jgi:hypothetical protein
MSSWQAAMTAETVRPARGGGRLGQYSPLRPRRPYLSVRSVRAYGFPSTDNGLKGYLMKTMLAGALVALPLSVPAQAAAYPKSPETPYDCRYEYMSNVVYIYCGGEGNGTVTICRYSDGTCHTRRY